MASVSSPRGHSAGIGGKPHVLFLTVHPLSDKTHSNWNTEIIDALVRHSVDVTTLSFLKESPLIQPQYIADNFTHICLLLLGEYPSHHTSFVKQLKLVIPEAQRLNPRLRVINGPCMAEWNSDKAYLRDLRSAGFRVPETTILSSRQPIDFVRFALNTQAHGNPVVVKPSISASGKNTHLVKEPNKLSNEDDTFLGSLLDLMQNGCIQGDTRPSSRVAAQNETSGDENENENEGSYGSIMLQEYMPDITKGEYSLCYIGGKLRYTVLKRPKSGGWQVNSEFGGTSNLLTEADVPDNAVEVSAEVLEWVSDRFGEELAYARVDGVCRDDGSFVLMELELIEPSLFLHQEGTRQMGLDAICEFVTKPPTGFNRSVSHS